VVQNAKMGQLATWYKKVANRENTNQKGDREEKKDRKVLIDMRNQRGRGASETPSAGTDRVSKGKKRTKKKKKKPTRPSFTRNTSIF